MNDFPLKQGGDFSFNNPSQNSQKPRRMKPVLIVFALVFLVVVAFFVWDIFFSADAIRERELQENYEQAMSGIKNYEDAMRADTYGGKTPQETLDMFIEALEKEDVGLASEYFVLEENGERNKEWADLLGGAISENKHIEIISVLKKAEPAGSSLDGYYGFEVRDENNKLLFDVGLKFNKYSGVWKIESL